MQTVDSCIIIVLSYATTIILTESLVLPMASMQSETLESGDMTTSDGQIELRQVENSSETPMFNTKAVVNHTGIPAPTLRAWERRYHLLAPERGKNAYRLYSERDIKLIQWLKDRLDEGMSISKAIALFRNLDTEQQQKQDQEKRENTADGQRTQAFRVTTPDKQPVLKPEQPFQPDQWQITDMYAEGIEAQTHTFRVIQSHLIEVFKNLDEQTAHILLGSMLSIYAVEQVCLEIITPTLWQIGEMWAKGTLTASVEHFASNFFRALLTNRFYVTPSPLQGPLVIVGGAPNEPHELPPLMLALILRRSGLRVAYLGQSIEAMGLLHTIKTLKPAAICLSVTIPAYIDELKTLACQIALLPAPQPTLVFGGQAFAQSATIIPEIPGIYMDKDLTKAASKLQSIVLNFMENKS